MVLASLTLTASLAVAGDDPFRFTTEAGAFEVVRWSPPPIAVLEPTQRTCRLAVTWSPDGLQARDRACPGDVLNEALATVAAWEVEGPPGIQVHELGEIWFVYPYEVGPEVAVLVRQSTGVSLELPLGIDPAPFAIRAWSFLRYPEAMLADPSEATCVVDVHADAAGRATDVTATGCAAPFQEAAVAAVRQWRFEPPLVHGEPIETSLTLSTTFDPHDRVRERAQAPEAQRHELWSSGQFDELTREERMFFIRATLLGTDDRDLGPGHVRVRLPAAPDLGDRDPTSFFDAIGASSSPPDLPDHPPVLLIHREGRSSVEIYEAPLPAVPGIDEASCRLTVQVDGERRVLSWAEACDEAVRLESLRAADAWILKHGGEVRQRERFGVLVEFEDGVPRLVFDADEVRTPASDLPEWVRLRRPSRTVHRVPPRLPRAVLEQGLPEGDCRLAVEVTTRGSAGSVQVLSCPDSVAAAAVRAVKRWRWSPALEDGEPIPEDTEVSIRFSP